MSPTSNFSIPTIGTIFKTPVALAVPGFLVCLDPERFESLGGGPSAATRDQNSTRLRIVPGTCASFSSANSDELASRSITT